MCTPINVLSIAVLFIWGLVITTPATTIITDITPAITFPIIIAVISTPTMGVMATMVMATMATVMQAMAAMAAMVDMVADTLA